MHNMRIIYVSETGKQHDTGQRVGEDDILVEGPDAVRTSIRIEHAQLLGERPVTKTARPHWE